MRPFASTWNMTTAPGLETLVKRYLWPTAGFITQLAVVVPVAVWLLVWTKEHACAVLPATGLSSGHPQASCGGCAIHNSAFLLGVTALAIVVARFVGKVQANRRDQACARLDPTRRGPWVRRSSQVRRSLDTAGHRRT